MEYHDYYILSFFSLDRSTSVSQLTHVLQGKRTPSMFYLAEINKWHHAFSQFKNISGVEIEKITQTLLRCDLIQNANKGFRATEKGVASCHSYFSNHYFPQLTRSFVNMNIRISFWERYQLFVQAFSELSYQNFKYAPVIKHPHHQENVRQLFQQFHKTKEVLRIEWIKEQHYIFSELEEKRAIVLMNHLTGHQRVGNTKAQVREYLSMARLEYYLYHQDSIESMLSVVRSNESKLPITNAIMNQLHKETNYGLSMSTGETYQLIKQGQSIQTISQIRHLKENTIREHILEMAFVLVDFPFEKFIPNETYDFLREHFEVEEDYSYKQAVSEKSDIEFMHYRLVELERIRKND